MLVALVTDIATVHMFNAASVKDLQATRRF